MVKPVQPPEQLTEEQRATQARAADGLAIVRRGLGLVGYSDTEQAQVFTLGFLAVSASTYAHHEDVIADLRPALKRAMSSVRASRRVAAEAATEVTMTVAVGDTESVTS